MTMNDQVEIHSAGSGPFFFSSAVITSPTSWSRRGESEEKERKEREKIQASTKMVVVLVPVAAAAGPNVFLVTALHTPPPRVLSQALALVAAATRLARKRRKKRRGKKGRKEGRRCLCTDALLSTCESTPPPVGYWLGLCPALRLSLSNCLRLSLSRFSLSLSLMGFLNSWRGEDRERKVGKV